MKTHVITDVHTQQSAEYVLACTKLVQPEKKEQKPAFKKGEKQVKTLFGALFPYVLRDEYR